MEKYSLYQIAQRLKMVIESWAGNEFWVSAEVKSVTYHPSGHVYLELVEKDDETDSTIAEARATIWRSTAGMVMYKFEAKTGTRLKAGMKVLLLGQFNYSPRYGLSINISDIDPTYTVGDLHQRRGEIIERLKRQGLMEMNKQRVMRVPTQRIAVISSATAAGFSDFVNTLKSNEQGFRYEVTLFQAMMQGEGAERSIIEAMAEIDEKRFDVVVMIRGGGASSDLLTFDSEALATACAIFPLPIITGIGHQRDVSIVDMVVYHNAITPTASAEWLIARTMGLYMELDKLKGDLDSAMVRFMEREKIRLERYGERLSTAAERYIEGQKIRLERYEERLEMLHPKNILKRGYSFTTVNGEIVRDAKSLSQGDIIETTLYNGKIKSRVLEN